MTGILYGVGVGPGDPELLTLKAARIIESATLVAYPTNPAGYSQARTIAQRWLNRQQELPMPIRFDCDRTDAVRAYTLAAGRISKTLAAGGDVAVLCEGDPLFYGSFIHLHEALDLAAPCIVVPGISSVHAAAGAAVLPLGSGGDTIATIPGVAGDERIRQALEQFETVAIIKPGTRGKRIANLIDECGRAADTTYIEHATRDSERIVEDIRTLTAERIPYFALFLVGRTAANDE